MKKLTEKQAIRSFETKIKEIGGIKTPNSGWIRELRKFLGISAKALAHLVGVDPSTILRFEQSEKNRSITLKTLDKLADAMNCDVAYILIPRKPISNILFDRAMRVAQKDIMRIDRTMSLEDQKIPTREQQQQIKDLAEQLIANGDKRIWEAV